MRRKAYKVKSVDCFNMIPSDLKRSLDESFIQKTFKLLGFNYNIQVPGMTFSRNAGLPIYFWGFIQ